MRGKFLIINKKSVIKNYKLKNIKLKEYYKKAYAEGITLISLVITIIILLILAGVAINISLSNNGIFR